MRMSDMINNFVCRDINLASKRLYLPSNMGRFGLFKLDTFLAAQKCSWIPRSFDLNEKGKLTLFLKSCGTITNIRKKPNQSTSKSSPLRDR
jgi:hypothetical protein